MSPWAILAVVVAALLVLGSLAWWAVVMAWEAWVDHRERKQIDDEWS